MFGFRPKPIPVRILDVPNKMYIDNSFIAVPLPNGKVLVIHGEFEHIRDEDANLIVQKTLDKIVA